jgi:hypothetical protein
MTSQVRKAARVLEMECQPNDQWGACIPHMSDLAMTLRTSPAPDERLLPWLIGCLFVQAQRDDDRASAHRFYALGVALVLQHRLDPGECVRRVHGLLEDLEVYETGHPVRDTAHALRAFRKRLN